MELKPCPFCGNTLTRAQLANPYWMLKKYHDKYAFAGCPKCGASTRLFFANNHTGSPILNKANEKAVIEAAIIEWNRRVNDAEVR